MFELCPYLEFPLITKLYVDFIYLTEYNYCYYFVPYTYFVSNSYTTLIGTVL